MFNLLFGAKRPVLVGCGLAALALAGWGSFTFAAMSSSRQLGAMQAERDAAVAEHRALQGAAGDLAQVETKLGAARLEFNRSSQGLAEIRIRIGAAQQELASLGKRAEQGGDRVNQTGSIRQPEPPKRPAR